MTRSPRASVDGQGASGPPTRRPRRRRRRLWARLGIRWRALLEYLNKAVIAFFAALALMTFASLLGRYYKWSFPNPSGNPLVPLIPVILAFTALVGFGFFWLSMLITNRRQRRRTTS